MLDFRQFEWLSFDCYGTLIDWEAGIVPALRKVLDAHGAHLEDEKLLAMYGDLEAEAESGEFRRYRDVLREVVNGLGHRLGFNATEAQKDSLPQSLPSWPPFPDTVDALRRLKQRYQLAIISNTDDDLFAGTQKHLGVEFDRIITAQQVRTYKPSLNNFERALERIGRPKEKLLHVAQSLYHDVAPTRKLGIASVWVNRRGKKEGPGATRASTATPDLEVPDLKSLADLVNSAR